MLLALAVGVDARRPRREVRPESLPHLEPGLVERAVEALDGVGVEASAEISRHRRSRDALRAQCVEEDAIVATQLDVAERAPAASRVVGDVQHVVGLVERAP